jgi:hypothetical protein
MNAADFTHGLKTAGFGTRMWVGLLVIAIACFWLGNPANREQVLDGLFAK